MPSTYDTRTARQHSCFCGRAIAPGATPHLREPRKSYRPTWYRKEREWHSVGNCYLMEPALCTLHLSRLRLKDLKPT